VKNFFIALFGLVWQALSGFWHRIRDGGLKRAAADSLSRLKSASAHSDTEYPFYRRRPVLIAAAAIICLIAVFIYFSGGSEPDLPRLKTLTAPSVRDNNGDTWSLQLMKGQSSFVRGTNNPGPPLTIRTDSEAWGDSITIGVHLEGQAGEKYVPGALKNGQWQPAPSFRIVAENGQVLAQGRFEYG